MPLPSRLDVALALVLVLAGCSASPMLPARSIPLPPTVADTTQQSGFFAGKNGDWLFTQSWLPRTRERAVLVVVHGLKDHSSRYADFAGGLARRGIAVESFDLRGHGHSSGPRAAIDAWSDYLDDLELFMGHVRQAHPNRPAFLFGHSMGGQIATSFVLKNKPRLQGFILSAAALSSEKVGGVKIFATKVTAGLFPDAGVFQLDMEKFSRDPAVVKSGQADPLVHQPGAPARTARALLASIEDTDAHMVEIDTPFLVLHGAADEVTEPGGSKALHARARTADKKLVLYPGLVHDLLHEPEHARVEADIAAWIDAHIPVDSR